MVASDVTGVLGRLCALAILAPRQDPWSAHEDTPSVVDTGRSARTTRKSRKGPDLRPVALAGRVERTVGDDGAPERP